MEELRDRLTETIALKERYKIASDICGSDAVINVDGDKSSLESIMRNLDKMIEIITNAIIRQESATAETQALPE